MFVIERIIGIVAPHRCAGCGSEGSLLCDWCRPDFALPLPSRCAICKKATPQSQVCANCRKTFRLRHIWVRTGYDGLPLKLVQGFKFEHQQAAAPILASLMAEALPDLPKDTIVCPIPTTTKHVRQRGYDHADLLARALAKQLGCKYLPLLMRDGQLRQVGSSRDKRLHQLKQAFRTHRQPPSGSPVLLVDDITTSGGTLSAAADCLHNAGVKVVDAVVFAQKE